MRAKRSSQSRCRPCADSRQQPQSRRDPCAPPHARNPRPARELAEGTDVGLSRPQEAEEIEPLVLACLVDTQQDEVFADSLGRAIGANYIAKARKRFDSVLGIVVVPRYAVMVQKSKEPL